MDKRMAWTGLALLGLFASTPALAEIEPGFYVGAGVGEASVEVDGTGFDESDTAFKVFGGYDFNRHFALEAAYFDGGTAEMTSAARAFGGSIEVGTSGLNLSIARAPAVQRCVFGACPARHGGVRCRYQDRRVLAGGHRDLHRQ